MVQKNNKAITWQAEEYIVPGRNKWWYLGLFLVGLALSALAVFLQWWTFLVLIIFCIITILVSTIKPPRKIDYSLTDKGLTEGQRLHEYENFKAFGILKENNNHYSAILIPKKRLGMSVKVYFPEGSGEAIVDALGSRLPMQEIKLDFLDKIVNFLRI